MDTPGALPSRAGGLALRVGLAIVLLIAAELSADLYSYLRGHSYEDPQMRAECYRNAAWKRAYFQELRQSLGRWRWHPYTYWTLDEFHGRYLNVDAGGIRRSWNRRSDDPKSGQRPLQIFMFGGSTMWGFGARDDYTIPSLVAKSLDSATPYRTEVVNFGLPAFVSMQEVLLLLEQLRMPHTPDLVVFYDGTDVFSSYENGVAGVTMDEQSRAREFNILTDIHVWRLYKATLSNMIHHSSLVAVAKKLARLLVPRSFRSFYARLVRPPSAVDTADISGARTLAKSVADFYLQDVRIIQHSGKELGFRSLFYLQPVLCFKKQLTPFERTIRIPGPDLGHFYEITYQNIMDQGGALGVHDLSRIVENATGPYFLDYFHMSEAGNEVIAQAMLPGILAALGEVKHPPPAQSRP
jgi:hypothetical protein